MRWEPLLCLAGGHKCRYKDTHMWQMAVMIMQRSITAELWKTENLTRVK